MHLRQTLRGLTSLPSQLAELISLLHEQNSLMRELVQFHTRRPAQTPYSQASEARRLRPPQPITPRTDKDVFAVSGSQLREVAKKMEERLTAPWRTNEIVPPPETFHPDQLTLPQPNRTDQPLPSGSARTD